MTSQFTAFDPNDPVQQQFLSGLALGETGNSSYAATEGFGGTNLSQDATDQYGFPQWQGDSTNAGPTHAAGIFQFEPSTWDSLAQQYGLNFGNTSDQEAGAWYLAQQTYNAKTGGNLYADLSTGQYGNVNSALSSIWPSVLGSGSNPQGLAAALAGGEGASIPFPVRPAGLALWLVRHLRDQHPEVRRHLEASSQTLKIGSSGSASSQSEA